MSKAIEQSVKEKLRNISKKEGIAFNSLLETLFLERFMVRVAKSRHKGSLIFKGGMCLAQYLHLGRQTRDLDFLLQKVESSEAKIREIFEEIAALRIDDGMSFKLVEVAILSIEHKKYPGYRVEIQGMLGQVKQKVSVDVGIGDVVISRTLEVEFLHDKGPLFENSASINAYPPEYIFAEKLEAILYFGESNSRMKDYFDCYQIIHEDTIRKDEFKNAIVATFDNRGTKIGQIPDYAEILSTRWNGFARLNKRSDIQFKNVTQVINDFLQAIGIRN